MRFQLRVGSVRLAINVGRFARLYCSGIQTTARTRKFRPVPVGTNQNSRVRA